MTQADHKREVRRGCLIGLGALAGMPAVLVLAAVVWEPTYVGPYSTEETAASALLILSLLVLWIVGAVYLTRAWNQWLFGGKVLKQEREPSIGISIEMKLSDMEAMNALDQLRARRGEILAVAAHYGAGAVRVFGSVGRGEASASSDLDLLVVMAPDRSLLDHIGLQHDLEALLGVPVDVVTERGLHPLIRDRVLSEARLL